MDRQIGLALELLPARFRTIAETQGARTAADALLDVQLAVSLMAQDLQPYFDQENLTSGEIDKMLARKLLLANESPDEIGDQFDRLTLAVQRAVDEKGDIHA